MKDLLKDYGSYLSFRRISDKFACKTNFLQYYPIISDIPNQLLFKHGIRPDDECCFCGGNDSIDHTFIHFSFTESFIQKITLWFNKTNNSQISPTTEELLFGITNRPFHSCLLNDLLPLNGSKA